MWGFANELLVFGALEVLVVRWEDDNHILLRVRSGHCSDVLLRPAVAKILIVRVATDEATDASDETADGTGNEAGHF